VIFFLAASYLREVVPVSGQDWAWLRALKQVAMIVAALAVFMFRGVVCVARNVLMCEICVELAVRQQYLYAVRRIDSSHGLAGVVSWLSQSCRYVFSA
jgi:hypothetical protein